MVELILIVTSISIILFITITSDKNKKEKLFEQKTFETILFENEMLEKDNLFCELKKRNFIDKVLCEYTNLKDRGYIDKEKVEKDEYFDNKKLTTFKRMIKNSNSEVEICQKLEIGRGEFLLLKNLYKK